MTTVEEIKTQLEDCLSYICLYVDKELVDFWFNMVPTNNGYLNAFNKLKEAQNPDKIVMAISDIEYEAIVSFIKVDEEKPKESIEKMEMVIYTPSEMKEKHPEVFEDE